MLAGLAVRRVTPGSVITESFFLLNVMSTFYLLSCFVLSNYLLKYLVGQKFTSLGFTAYNFV
jgi:hypothetical protein